MKTALKGFLLMAGLAVVLLNVAESNLQELIAPRSTPGFFRVDCPERGVYRLTVAGEPHDVDVAALGAVAEKALIRARNLRPSTGCQDRPA